MTSSMLDPDRFLREYDQSLEAPFLSLVNDPSGEKYATKFNTSAQPSIKTESSLENKSIFEDMELDFTSSTPFVGLKINQKRLDALRKNIGHYVSVK